VQHGWKNGSCAPSAYGARMKIKYCIGWSGEIQRREIIRETEQMVFYIHYGSKRGEHKKGDWFDSWAEAREEVIRRAMKRFENAQDELDRCVKWLAKAEALPANEQPPDTTP
jgi:hypothetical protein